MEMLKFGKFAALALAMAVAVGCSSKGGDNAGEGAVDPNAGYGANTGAVDGSLSEEAALRAITTFYFEYDSSDLKPEAMRALDVHAKDLKANGARVVLEGNTDERGTREYNMALGRASCESRSTLPGTARCFPSSAGTGFLRRRASSCYRQRRAVLGSKPSRRTA
jgi:hypothetical protein